MEPSALKKLYIENTLWKAARYNRKGNDLKTEKMRIMED